MSEVGANFGNIEFIVMRLGFILSGVCISAAVSFAQTAGTPSHVSNVTSKDGTRIAVECMGAVPSLLIVHGGTGDRSRWKPLLPLFASHFSVCAMDRRGHGESGAGPNYALTKEFQDVAAVVKSLAGPVFVLGHSIGGVCALEAAKHGITHIMDGANLDDLGDYRPGLHAATAHQIRHPLIEAVHHDMQFVEL